MAVKSFLRLAQGFLTKDIVCLGPLPVLEICSVEQDLARCYKTFLV
jgi:hypothetical protein